VTEDMVKAMKPGSVIVDLAAERGGNCELTQLGKTITAHGVTIIGPDNIPATIPNHASQMYGKNMEVLLGHMINTEGNLSLDFEDEVIVETLIAPSGNVPHARMRAMLGMEPIVKAALEADSPESNQGESS